MNYHDISVRHIRGISTTLRTRFGAYRVSGKFKPFRLTDEEYNALRKFPSIEIRHGIETVKAPVQLTGLRFTKEFYEANLGNKAEIEVEVFPSDLEEKPEILISVSDDKIAKLSYSGRGTWFLEGKLVGKTTINAKIGNHHTHAGFICFGTPKFSEEIYDAIQGEPIEIIVEGAQEWSMPHRKNITKKGNFLTFVKSGEYTIETEVRGTLIRATVLVSDKSE